jgi:hypothetical protein
VPSLLRVELRPVITLPQFRFAPFAYAFDEICYAGWWICGSITLGWWCCWCCGSGSRWFSGWRGTMCVTDHDAWSVPNEKCEPCACLRMSSSEQAGADYSLTREV